MNFQNKHGQAVKFRCFCHKCKKEIEPEHLNLIHPPNMMAIKVKVICHGEMDIGYMTLVMIQQMLSGAHMLRAFVPPTELKKCDMPGTHVSTNPKAMTSVSTFHLNKWKDPWGDTPTI